MYFHLFTSSARGTHTHRKDTVTARPLYSLFVRPQKPTKITQISKTTYVRALHKAVTLDPDLVHAYHADVERQYRREEQDLPQAALGAFREGGVKPPAAGVTPAPAGTASGLGGSGMEGISTLFAAAQATSSMHQQLPVNSRGGASGTSIMDGERRGGFVGGAAGNVPRTGEAEIRYKLLDQVTMRPNLSMLHV